MKPKHRILVVEDKQHERLAIARLLWQEDYEVLLAENPQQASGFLDDQIDLVISDLRMGEHSGIDLLRLWKKRELLLAGWIHYLCFDLFIGAWEIRDSQRHDIPHLVMIPCLLMTFMLGPIGLLFYFAIRTAKLRSVAVA